MIQSVHRDGMDCSQAERRADGKCVGLPVHTCVSCDICVAYDPYEGEESGDYYECIDDEEDDYDEIEEEEVE